MIPEDLKKALDASGHEWADGCLSVAFFENDSEQTSSDHAISILENSKVFKSQTIAWLSPPSALTRLLAEVPYKQVIWSATYLLRSEFKMYGDGRFSSEVIEKIAKQFTREFSQARFYANFAPSKDQASCGWNPVTRHTTDFFLVGIDKGHVGYILYTDDE